MPFTTTGPTYVNLIFSPGLRRTRMENVIISMNTNQRPGDWRAAGQLMYEKPELGMLFGPCHSGVRVVFIGIFFEISFLLLNFVFELFSSFLVYRERLGESSRRAGGSGHYFERSPVYGGKCLLLLEICIFVLCMCLYFVFNEVHSFRGVEEDFGVIRDNGPVLRNSTCVDDIGVRGKLLSLLCFAFE